MTPQEFIAEAKRRNLPEDEARAKFNQLKAQGAFDEAPQAQQETKKGFSFANMVKNIPSSAANYAGTMVDGLMNIDQLPSGLHNMASGFAQKYHPDAIAQDKVPVANQIEKAVGNRYGSIDKALSTLESDPVGVLGDVSMAAMPASGIPKVAKFGAAIDPFNIAVNSAKLPAKAMTKAFPNMANNMYQSAAKFSTVIPPGERAAMAQTALDYQIMPTTKGVDKLDAIRNGLATKIDEMISSADNAGQSIPMDTVFKYIDELKSELGGKRIRGQRNINQIDKVIDEFKEHMASKGADSFTPRELQQFKIDAYNEATFGKSAQQSTRAEDATYKSVARAAKDTIEDFNPEIKPTNKELGRLLELEPNLQRSASRIENRDLIGIGAPIKIGTGAMMDSQMATAAATVSAILDIPQWKAYNAIKLNQIKNSGLLDIFGNNSKAAWQARQGLIGTGLLAD